MNANDISTKATNLIARYKLNDPMPEGLNENSLLLFVANKLYIYTVILQNEEG